MNFKDKVVVITGGTSGIGKQTAIEFSRKGAHVVAFTVDKEEVCKQAIKEIGNEAFYIHCYVSKEEAVLTIVPKPCFCIFNNSYFKQRKTPFISTSTTKSHVFSEISVKDS